MAEKANRTIKHPLMVCKIFSTFAYRNRMQLYSAYTNKNGNKT